MVEAGVIDAAKVTRSALENAASIAAMILTTEALITDIPEKDKAPPPRPCRTTRPSLSHSPFLYGKKGETDEDTTRASARYTGASSMASWLPKFMGRLTQRSWQPLS